MLSSLDATGRIRAMVPQKLQRCLLGLLEAHKAAYAASGKPMARYGGMNATIAASQVAKEQGLRAPGDADRDKVRRALASLERQTPDVESWIGRRNSRYYSHVSFEERQARAHARSEKFRKRRLAQTLVDYLGRKGDGYKAATSRDGATIEIDPDVLIQFIRDHVEPQAI